MGAFARLVILALTAVLGLAPGAGTRELRGPAPIERVEQEASRPDGHSIAINRGEKQRGVHQPRVASAGVDPASATDDDELALVDGVRGPDRHADRGERLGYGAWDARLSRRPLRANACRGPPVLA